MDATKQRVVSDERDRLYESAVDATGYTSQQRARDTGDDCNKAKIDRNAVLLRFCYFCNDSRCIHYYLYRILPLQYPSMH